MKKLLFFIVFTMMIPSFVQAQNQSSEKIYSINVPIQDLFPGCPVKDIFICGKWGGPNKEKLIKQNPAYKYDYYGTLFCESYVDYTLVNGRVSRNLQNRVVRDSERLEIESKYIDDAAYFSTNPNATSVSEAQYIVTGYIIKTPEGCDETMRLSVKYIDHRGYYRVYTPKVPLYFIKATPEVYKYETNSDPRICCAVELSANDWVKTYIPNPDAMSFEECKDAICKLEKLLSFNYEETDYFKFLLSKYEGKGDVKLLTKAGREEFIMNQYEKEAKEGDIDAALKLYAKKGIEEGYPLLKELLLRDWNTLKWSRKAGNMNYQGFTGLINDISVDLEKVNPALNFDFHKSIYENKNIPEVGLELIKDYEEGRGTPKKPAEAFNIAKKMRQELINEPLSKYSRQMTTCKLIDFYWTGTGTIKNLNEATKLLMEVTANGVGIPQCYDWGDHKQDKCTMRYRLGLIYENGYGGITKDITEAFEFYEAAYGSGAFGLKDSPQAAYKLAYWTEKGRGYITDRITRRPDISRARALYHYAAQYGNATTKAQAKQALARIGY